MPVLTDKVDLCHAWVEFPGGLVANLTASRVSAERIRKLRLFASESLLLHRLRRTDRLVGAVGTKRKRRRNRASIVDVAKDEPLKAELEAFIGACRGETTPIVDGRTGAAALAAACTVRECVERR